ncbi:MAG: MmoB/DmpM family protein [Ilumatobacteraceae bacterium]
MSEISTAYINNRVGPIMRHGDLAKAVAEAAETDNPGKTIVVEDKVAYLRIETDDELVLTRQTIEDLLGRPFAMNDLEVELASFAGRIDTQTDRVRFYYATHLSEQGEHT